MGKSSYTDYDVKLKPARDCMAKKCKQQWESCPKYNPATSATAIFGWTVLTVASLGLVVMVVRRCRGRGVPQPANDCAMHSVTTQKQAVALTAEKHAVVL